MRNIMILGASETQIPFIKIAKEKGYGVIITDIDKNAPGLKYGDVAINISGENKEKILEYARKFNIEGIITKTERLLATVAYVNEKLNLRGIRSKAARASIDKVFLRKCMRENGIDICKSYQVESLEDVKAISNKLSYPVVMKPIDGGGSRGVVRINSKNELEKNFDYCMTYSREKKLIIEDFIDGKACSVELITQNGHTHVIAVSEGITSGSPYFVETQHLIPANFSINILKQIEDMCIKTLKAVEVDNAVSFFDMRITKNGPIVIEIAARFAGDYICTDLIKLATGIDMYESLINIVMGEEVSHKNKFNKYAVVKFITKFNYENAIKNHKSIIQDDNYVKHEYYNRTNVSGLFNSSDRLGYYIFNAENRESLLKSLSLID
ncbi:ATP-grasp domain-containing protein [Clostridium niameyense]|uniref:ATP-grasp domain-containing protein n=1 Tax=Clostridium niameyense TaxID=1622073 RepID=UPI000B13B7B5|nr:ATP-grasp domain-containing protein [Clostridium niameyense]